ncbi:uncharacterized protein EDB91DRAFT_540302 [Suillus paluster]|uniref:uncharacterized protein n=1 Tax=Suillus paluster TaxID=48578 RepID=UPI001B88391C|nr:uncharacterized protein EDB91DRAFT_540302 [Suillus paluster]KAG1736172.1 hypothetical protein EDB91DRAFT_540302 [Suillus paluster]
MIDIYSSFYASTRGPSSGHPQFIMPDVQALWASYSSKQLSMASFTLVVYDHVITFPQEVTFFWSGPWSAARILYLSIRYLALIEVILVSMVRQRELTRHGSN